MKKSLFVLPIFCLLLMNFVIAETVQPFETKELPQITSNVSLDKQGVERTYLYCSWRIDGQGEEAVQMTGEICPETVKVFAFEDDETYYVRIDYADIIYSTIDNEWVLITTGNAGELQVDYELDVPEPPQSLFDLIYDTIIGKVKYWICQLFPSLEMCS